MFYSPKKDIERYVTLKNHQISTLKQELQHQKITQESIEVAKRKLQKLKNHYNVLISQNHHQLIETLRKNEDKRKNLTNELILKQKQLKLKNSEKSDVTDMKKQIIDKLKKSKERVDSQRQRQSQLLTKRQKLDLLVLKSAQQNEKMRTQNQQTKTLVQMAQKQLIECQTKLMKDQQKARSLQKQMNQLGSNLLTRKQDLRCMTSSNKMQQLKMQNLQMKIQYLLQVKSNLLDKKQKLNNQKLVMKQRSELNKHQTVSTQIMNVLVRVTKQMKQTKEVQQQACEREIKEKLMELQLTECVNNQLTEQAQMWKARTMQIQQKTSKIQKDMKGISMSDWQLMSMTMKKYGDAGSKMTNSPLKTMNLNSWENKQNLNKLQINFKQSMWSKLNPMELANTAEDQQSVQIN